MSDFKDAVVGDRVYSPEHGWGEVYYQQINYFTVKFNDADNMRYSYNGGRYHAYEDSLVQSLFWDVPVAPPKPKKMVKKEITGYILVSELGDISNLTGDEYEEITFTRTRQVHADTYVTIVYEVEE